MRVAVCGNAACVRLLCRRSAAWQPHSLEAPIFATIYPERCFPKSLKIPVTATQFLYSLLVTSLTILTQSTKLTELADILKSCQSSTIDMLNIPTLTSFIWSIKMLTKSAKLDHYPPPPPPPLLVDIQPQQRGGGRQ